MIKRGFSERVRRFFPLSFTGAVNATYDTRSPVVLHISSSSITSAPAAYVSTEAEDVIQRLKAIQNENTFCFALFTDFHYAPVRYFDAYGGSSDYDTVAQNIVDAINLVNGSVPLECVVTLGDNIEGQNYGDNSTLASTTAERATGSLAMTRSKADDLNAILSGLQVPRISCKGNHDDGSISAYYGESDHVYKLAYIMQDADYYQRFFKHNANKSLVSLSDPASELAAYLDLPTSKVRMVFLNSIDLPYQADSNGNCPYIGGTYSQYLGGQHTFGYQEKQLDWLANTALKLPSSKWQVLIFQHHPMLNVFSKHANTDSAYQRFNYDVLEGILHAFQHGTAYTHSSTTGKAPNGAESALFGCTVSADFTEQGPGQIMAIWNGHIHRDLFTTTTFESFPSSSVTTPNFINKFSTSDADFMDGYRLNSSGVAVAQAGSFISGFIACKHGDTIRVRCPNGTYASGTGKNHPCIARYGTDKALVGNVYYAETASTDANMTMDADNLGFSLTITTSNTAYIRAAGNGSTEGYVITVNEEISYTTTAVPDGGTDTLFVSTMVANPNEGAVAPAWNGITYGHAPAAANETSIDFVTVDPIAHKIYTTRYGAGVDREMTYAGI
ncbi:MAG: hypothetical protein LUE11_07050 [Clostridia bacterium]|nr:hypothetical protein [Clostridia bacterium]